MANKLRGEIEIEAGGKTYTLRMSINAIAEIEQRLNLGINEIAAALSDMPRLRIGTLRAIVWGCLREHHKDLAIEDAGEIIGEMGVQLTLERINAAFLVAFPSAEGASPSPVADQGGTGKAS